MSRLIDYLKERLAEGETKLVIQVLRQLAKTVPQLKRRENEYLMLAGQFNRLQKQVLEGTISGSNLELSTNRIRRNTTSYIDGIPSSVEPPSNLEEIFGIPVDGSAPLLPDENPDTPVNKGSGTTKILMLQANPHGTVRLDLNSEHVAIHTKLSGQHDFFQLIPKTDVKITEMSEHIVRENPSILHFSGHGRTNTPTPPDPNDPFAEPQPGDDGGLLLVGENGRDLHPASTEYVDFLFNSIVNIQGVPLQIVLLNACYSGEQAEVIAKHVPYVIGTSDAVLDKAAWAFSKGFYFRLAHDAGTQIDESAVRKAFNNGQMQAVPMGEPPSRFVLYVNGEKQ